MQKDVFLNSLDDLIRSKHLLNHDFYKAWSRGELSLECLQEYAKEYYQHVKAFPTYLSALHSRSDDADTRRILLQNLIEEEAGSPNHPELWKNFALALGVTEDELKSHHSSAEIKHLIGTFRSICMQQPTEAGLVALYAYESQIPEICISKIDGLKKHYGMQKPDGWEYFRVHIAADTEHAAQERHLLKSYITGNNQEMVTAAANKVLDALWNFLSSLCCRYNISCATH